MKFKLSEEEWQVLGKFSQVCVDFDSDGFAKDESKARHQRESGNEQFKATHFSIALNHYRNVSHAAVTLINAKSC